MRVRGRCGSFCDAREKRQQRDVAKRDAVAGCAQGFEPRTMRAIDCESRAKMRGELALRVSRNLDGRELPHAREEHVIVRARIPHEQRAAARIAQDGGGDRMRTAAGLRRGAGIVAVKPRARARHQSRDRARAAARRLRRADRFAELHQRLIPVAGRVVREQVAAAVSLRRSPVPWARRSPRMAPSRARTRATLPSSTASGTSYAMLRTAAAV